MNFIAINPLISQKILKLIVDPTLKNQGEETAASVEDLLSPFISGAGI